MVVSSQELLLEFRTYGFHVNVSWLEACLADQRRRLGRVGEGSAGRLRDAVFEQLLWSDLRGYSTGEGLSASILASASSVIKGPLVLQLEQVLNVGVHMEDAATTRGMLKCLFSYGAQNTAVGFEYSHITNLGLNTPRGTKVLVENCLVERGMLLLTYTNTKVLGGGLSSDTQAATIAAAPAPTPTPAAGAAAMSVDNSSSSSRNLSMQPFTAPQVAALLPPRARIQLAHEGQQGSMLPDSRSRLVGAPSGSTANNNSSSSSSNSNTHGIGNGYSSTASSMRPFEATAAQSQADAAARARVLAEEEEDPSKEMYDDFYDPTEDDFSPPTLATRQSPQHQNPSRAATTSTGSFTPATSDAAAPSVLQVQQQPAMAPARVASPPFVSARSLAGVDSVDSHSNHTSQNPPSSSSQPSSSRDTFSALHGDALLSAQTSHGGDDSQPSPVQRLTFVSPNSTRTTASAGNPSASPNEAALAAAADSSSSSSSSSFAGGAPVGGAAAATGERQEVVGSSPTHRPRREAGPCPVLPWGRLADLPLQPPPSRPQGAQPPEQWRVKGCCSDVQSFKLKKRNVALRIYVEDGTAPKRVCLLAESLVLRVLSWPGSVKELAALKKENKAEFSAVLDRGAAALRCLEGILTIGKMITFTCIHTRTIPFKLSQSWASKFTSIVHVPLLLLIFLCFYVLCFAFCTMHRVVAVALGAVRNASLRRCLFATKCKRPGCFTSVYSAPLRPE